MNFCKIENCYINLDNILFFKWEENWLHLHDSNPQPLTFYDPDKKLLKALCSHLTINI